MFGTQAIRGNLKNWRKTWARISQVLRAEHAPPRVCGMFYRATVQSILLYGSETWTVAPANLAMMEGFHSSPLLRGIIPAIRRAAYTWKPSIMARSAGATVQVSLP